MQQPFPRKRWTIKPPVGVQLDWGHPLSSQIAGVYLLNEGAGPPHGMIHKSPGALTGGVQWVSGDKGPVISSDGSTGYVDCGSSLPNPVSGVYSVFVRFYPQAAGYYPMLVSRADGSGNNWELSWGYEATLLPYLGFVGGATLGANKAVVLNAWNDIGFTSDGATVCAYVNGQPAGSGSGSWRNGNGAVNITRRASDGYFGTNQCLVDRVIIWERCITARGALELYTDPYCIMQPQMQPRFWSIPAAGGSISGDLNQTLGALTSVATGAVAVQGDVTKTLGALTCSAQAAVAVQGALSATLGVATVSSEATVSVQGVVSQTLGTLTSVATGQVDVQGSLTVTLGALTTSAAGSVAIQGALSATLGEATAASTGTVDVAGSLSQTLGVLTVLAQGAVAVAGVVSATLDPLTVVAEGMGGASAFGVLDATLGALTVSASGTALVQGSLSQTLGTLTSSSSGQTAVTGSVSATLGPCAVVATGTVDVRGSVAVTLGPLTSSATGTGSIAVSGTLLVTLGVLTLSSQGTGVDPSLSLPGLASLSDVALSQGRAILSDRERDTASISDL